MAGQQPASSSVSVVMANDAGVPVEAQDDWTTLIDSVTFDDDPTEQNSAAMSVAGYSDVVVLVDVESNGSPTNIRFLPQFSDDDEVTWWDFEMDYWAAMYFEDQDTADGVKKAYKLDVAGVDDVRMRVVATGTDAGGNEFVVTVKARAYR